MYSVHVVFLVSDVDFDHFYSRLALASCCILICNPLFLRTPLIFSSIPCIASYSSGCTPERFPLFCCWLYV